MGWFLFFWLLTRSVQAAAPVGISHFLPNPANEADEYIELINSSSDPINLSGYQLDDEPNAGSAPYNFPASAQIAANAVLRCPKSQTGLILNNSKQSDQAFADQVRLLDPTGQVLDSITYISTQTDIPISHSSPTPTPVPTSLPSPTPSPSATPPPLPSPTPSLALRVKPSPTVLPSPVSTLQVLSATTFLTPAPLPPLLSNSTSPPASTWPAWVLIALGLLSAGLGLSGIWKKLTSP